MSQPSAARDRQPVFRNDTDPALVKSVLALGKTEEALATGRTVDVLEFGAVADTGVTDNYAAFARAIHEANARRALVYVPFGGPGNEYWLKAGSPALPTLTTARGLMGEPVPIAAGTVIRLVVTPAANTSMSWFANFGGYER